MNNNDERDIEEENYNKNLLATGDGEAWIDPNCGHERSPDVPRDTPCPDPAHNPARYPKEVRDEYRYTQKVREEFWYTQKSPTASGYDWLLTEPLYVQLLSIDGQVLAYDDSHTFAAILDTEMRNLELDTLLTVNAQIINWGSHYPALRAIVNEMRAQDLGWLEPATYYDPIIPDPTGTLEFCSVHGYVRVIKP